MEMTRPPTPAGRYSKSHGTTGTPAGSVASRTRCHPQPLSRGSSNVYQATSGQAMWMPHGAVNEGPTGAGQTIAVPTTTVGPLMTVGQTTVGPGRRVLPGWWVLDGRVHTPLILECNSIPAHQTVCHRTIGWSIDAAEEIVDRESPTYMTCHITGAHITGY